MPDTNHRAPITTHGYRCAGKPAIHHAHAGHGPDESARPLCGMPVVPDESDSPSCGVPVVPDESARPLCGMPVVPDESERPSCGVPVVPDESDSPLCGMPVMPDESRARASPGRCPSCHRVSCAGESPSRPVTCHAPAQHTPVADAANRCVANIFSLVRHGAS